MIDGAANNNVFGLASSGNNGGQAGAQPVSMETIEQIQVSVAPFDVRQSGFTGGATNAITKSGTNKFHGSAYYYGYNQDLIGIKYPYLDGTGYVPKYQEQTQYTWVSPWVVFFTSLPVLTLTRAIAIVVRPEILTISKTYVIFSNNIYYLFRQHIINVKRG